MTFPNNRLRFGGGVALYVNKHLSCMVRTDLMVDNLQSISVQIENGRFKPFIVTSDRKKSLYLISVILNV